MADAAKEQAISLLKTSLDKIAEYNAETLAEGKDLGAINFRTGQHLFAQSIQLAK